MRSLITMSLLACGLLAGCAANDSEITEMHVDNAGNLVQGDSYTRDELWMSKVNELVFNESRGDKPPPGSPSWETFWRASYADIRAKPRPTWPSSHFKTSEDLVTYIKQQRAIKKLPLFDDH